MENVSAFNDELSGLYESKPPISKAKMAAITRAAMKAIKFYKHVVQSVEKFILKCKPEYKIPGLYVIDSIVRQSRHQFGPEKDVFAPRFARNVKSTFANLFRGAPEDKSRIIRVLNLWQKNNVFAPDVIQPLFDLADPNHPIYQLPPGTQDSLGTDANGMNISMPGDSSMASLDDSHGIPELSIGHQTTNAKTLDQSTLRQLQHIQQILIRQTAAATNEIVSSSSSCSVGGGSGNAGANQSDSVKFNKKVLEYDYDEEEDHDDNSASPHVSNVLDGNNLTQLLKDPNVLRQLQTLQQYKKQQEEKQKQIKLNEMRIQEEAFEKHLQNVLKGTSGPSSISLNQSVDINDKEVEFVSEDGKIEVINLDGNDSRSPTPERERYNSKRRRTSRSRSRDRNTGGARGSGGNERDRMERRRRSRSRSSRSRSRSPKGSSRRRGSSRERSDRGGPKDKDREKEKDREYERERRRKGLPDLKKENLSVCSTTLWVGHLSKLVQQEELSDAFGKYGDIISIDMIIPRGCAFIVMNRRQDAYKAMGSLKNFKMQSRTITISWAAGKGVKSKEWKDYWDLDLGVSYIPWSKLNKDTTDLEALEEGGMFDDDSMPSWMKDKVNQTKVNHEKASSLSTTIFPATGLEGLHSLDTTQPPPNPGGQMLGPPLGMVTAFPMGPPVPPRMMGPPMGMPPGMHGLPPMPPMVPGMPPPGMMPPHGMMPPGNMIAAFPPMPPPHLDKGMGPPPSINNVVPLQNDGNTTGSHPPLCPPPQFMGNMHMPHLGMPPPFQQPPPNQSPSVNTIPQSNDDQMDIEMDDDLPASNNSGGGKTSQSQPQQQGSFNQPPPLFPNFPSDVLETRRNERGAVGNNEDRPEIDFGPSNRNRDSSVDEFNNNNKNSRGPPGSRWNDRRSDRDRSRDGNMNRGDQGPPHGWKDNGMGPNFQGSKYNENNGRSALNIPPLDLGNPFFDMRHDEFNEDRRGNNGPPIHFHPNNRFGGPPGDGGPPGGPMHQIRGGPPQFGPRLGNIFMRGHGPRNGRDGGGGNFIHNNFSDRHQQFDRENWDNRSGGGGCRGMRGGTSMQDRRGGRGNWRDDDDIIERDRGGRRGGRYQNRDRSDERGAPRERERGSSGGRDRNSRDDRSSRERGAGGNDRRNRRTSLNRNENDTQQKSLDNTFKKNANKRNDPPQDTEDDWDLELKDFNMESTKVNEVSNKNNDNDDKTLRQDKEKNVNDTCSAEAIFVLPAPAEQQQNNNKRNDESGGNFNNTPLYDEPSESISNNNQQISENKFNDETNFDKREGNQSNNTESISTILTIDGGGGGGSGE